MGCFDPYSDDPRLGIQKISLCKYSNKLLVAGTAGQVRTSPSHEVKRRRRMMMADCVSPGDTSESE